MFERLRTGQRWILIGLLYAFATALTLLLWTSLSSVVAWSDAPVTSWEWASFQWRSSYGESLGPGWMTLALAGTTAALLCVLAAIYRRWAPEGAEVEVTTRVSR